MKVTKTIGLLCSLILAMLAVQSAYGINVLPYSSYGLENKWAGYKNYNEENFNVRVYFNVYTVSSGEFNLLDPQLIPEEDEYIYVYKIENRGDENNDIIGAFNLLYANGSAIPQHIIHYTTSTDDFRGGIAPDAEGTTNEGEWVWSGDNGYIEAGQQSWLLMFTSDHAPTRGKVEIRSASDLPAPIPEPASIILFGSAVGWIISGRNNKRQSS